MNGTAIRFVRTLLSEDELDSPLTMDEAVQLLNDAEPVALSEEAVDGFVRRVKDAAIGEQIIGAINGASEPSPFLESAERMVERFSFAPHDIRRRLLRTASIFLVAGITGTGVWGARLVLDGLSDHALHLMAIVSTASCGVAVVAMVIGGLMLWAAYLAEVVHRMKRERQPMVVAPGEVEAVFLRIISAISEMPEFQAEAEERMMLREQEAEGERVFQVVQELIQHCVSVEIVKKSVASFLREERRQGWDSGVRSHSSSL